jgi:hypothetical protein
LDTEQDDLSLLELLYPSLQIPAERFWVTNVMISRKNYYHPRLGKG